MPLSEQKLNLAIFAKRRQKLARKMGTGVAIVFAAQQPTHHTDAYHPNQNLVYLTGCPEPSCALVLVASKAKVTQEIFYCQKRNPNSERWTGPILGLAQARHGLGFAQVKPWQGTRNLLAETLGNHSDVFMEFPENRETSQACLALLVSTSQHKRARLHNLWPLLGELRMVKERWEINSIKAAARQTVLAFLELCRVLPQAGWERELSASLGNSYTSIGGTHAFQPIVACGKNACIAHYVANQSRLQKGKLLLVDTGCKLAGYTADLSRVVPINHSFTTAQCEMYEVVLAAQKQALGKIRPGNTLAEANKAASLELARGLVQMGICHGRPAKVITSQDFAQYYFHSIGHMLGMNVHDPFITNELGNAPPLRTNMVITVEPGLYLDNNRRIPAELRNTGIRVEDTIAVTATGHDNLTASAAKSIKDLEALLQQ